MTTMDSATRLERRYRRLLWAYPREYRKSRADEILGTLMEIDEGRRWPAPREAAALLTGGLRTRIRANRERPPRQVWRDGLRFAVLAALAAALLQPFIDVEVSFTDAAPVQDRVFAAIAMLLTTAALAVAARGRYWLAIGACAAGWAAIVTSFQLSEHNWGAAAFIAVEPVVAIVGLIVLAIRRVPGGRAWPWLALLALLCAEAIPSFHLETRYLAVALRTGLAAILLLTAVVDARLPMIGTGLATGMLFAQTIVMLSTPMPASDVVSMLGTTAAYLALTLVVGPGLHAWRRRSSTPDDTVAA
ncbi:hypothetical protein [Hamadaea tsunoensis]|uniref:hypothetical protein n=1 Tax=Hamadaea tsunoensis TaxID=53368 RepID=UPI0004172E8C|nr:hypothetical protein [Hamadaea tsunoensis]